MSFGAEFGSEGVAAGARDKSPSPEASALRRCALFADMPDAIVDAARRAMRLRVVEDGRDIVDQGATDSGEVYFLLSGRVDLFVVSPQGASVWIAALGAGEIFGDLEAIDGVPRSVFVRAAGVCRLGVLPRAAFVDMVTRSPELALGMLRVLATRLRRQNDRYVEKSAVDIPGRVGRELLRRATTFSGGAAIEPPPSPTEIARAIGARRETVSREIARLLKTGALRREGERLIVADRRALAEPDED